MTDTQKITDTILSAIKKRLSAEKKKEDFVTSTIELCAYDYHCGNETFYKVTSGWQDKIFKDVEKLSRSDIREISNNLVRGLKALSEVKGWGNLTYILENTCESGSWYSRSSIPFPCTITIMANPCKEFNSLANFIKKYGNFNLDPNEVYGVYIGGKRGVVYGEEGDRRYLCHKPKACEKLLATLRDTRGTKDLVVCKKRVEDDIDPWELEVSRRNEVEFGGYRHNGVEVTIKTPSGKVKATIMVA